MSDIDRLKDMLYDAEFNDWYVAVEQLEQRLKEAEKVIDMVEDNRKMPHQHKDYYERLCCLSERAREYNEKYKGGNNE